jgi:NAD(P)-dependent dehydrogenase (short-subunit alcohol dehydrogenase family)
MGRVEGKVAIVTGSASGIGREVAGLLAREGAKVVVADLNAEGAEVVAKEIRSAGGEAIAQPTDVSQETEVAAMVQAAVDTFGGLHVLHNNAAQTAPAAHAKDTVVTDIAVEDWDRSMAITLRGTFLGCKHAVPHMVRAGGGSIVNTSSNSALAGDFTQTAYATAKAGVNALTLFVATQFGKQNVRCNAITPGMIMTQNTIDACPPEIAGIIEQSNLLPRLGQAIDIANTVLFLASDDSSFITGMVIRVDGGQLAHLPHFASLNTTGLTTTHK